MSLGDWTAIEVVLGGALFLGGVALGLVLARGSRRLRLLEAELAQVNERSAAYRDQVEKHFSQTSDLFADLTRQYSAVWDHLAEGARELCADRPPGIGRGFSEGSRLLLGNSADSVGPDEPPEAEPMEPGAEAPASESESA